MDLNDTAHEVDEHTVHLSLYFFTAAVQIRTDMPHRPVYPCVSRSPSCFLNLKLKFEFKLDPILYQTS